MPFLDKHSFSDKLLNISSIANEEEPILVQNLLKEASFSASDLRQIKGHATSLVEMEQHAIKSSHIASLMHRYGLHTPEGLALMRLSEALLRIPDSATKDALIADTIGKIEAFSSNEGGEAFSKLVNSSSSMLKLARFVAGAGNQQSKWKSVLGSMFSSASGIVMRPIIELMVTQIARYFIVGETIKDALGFIQKEKDNPFLYSFDMLGESARSKAQAEHFFRQYSDAISAIAHLQASLPPAPIHQRHGISVKLSALHPRYRLLQIKRVNGELLPLVKSLLLEAKKCGVPVTLDAEELDRFDMQIDFFRKLITDPDLIGYDGLGIVIQAYHKRTRAVIDLLADLARDTGKRIPIRLVKGAYWDTEIKIAQKEGHHAFGLFTEKHHTDVSYMACMKQLLKNREVLYPQFATHNAFTIAACHVVATELGARKGEFEFQMLQGMGSGMAKHVAEQYGCRIYAPVGSHVELLPYLIRRLLENGANNSFVHQLAQAVPLDELLENPAHKAEQSEGKRAAHILLPQDICRGERKNSLGIDAGNVAEMTQLEQELLTYRNKTYTIASLVKGYTPSRKQSRATVLQPQNLSCTLGEVILADKATCDKAMINAHQAFPSWSKRSMNERATLLESAADLLESHQTEALSLAMCEAGKTIKNAVGEVREAIDFLRYYAAEARKLAPKKLHSPVGERDELRITGRGVFVCISPWNFPLAIFTGQVAAALVTGNCVVAKPAEQTAIIAHFMVKLMYKAGIPEDVIQLVIGDGKSVGQTLMEDPRLDGVAFTGSNVTAKLIQRTLATKHEAILPFIAETGGQNCLIADSSALPEQLVDDVIYSAFDSAGQRCSACRVLYLPEETADHIITLLTGAMKELIIGNPCDFNTDIGPVIDERARHNLQSYIDETKQRSTTLYACPIHAKESGHYVAPHAFLIQHISEIPGEIFGPVLHIRRYRYKDIDKIIEEINSTGYGLTFGIHSRIHERIQYISSRVRAGNIYINQGTIGAVVGVQPFGGMGLSGTGPKAGGPHYLKAFMHEQAISENTTAIGGNVDLLK